MINSFPNKGYGAMQMLIQIINEVPLEKQTLKVQTQLVVRSSCREYHES